MSDLSNIKAVIWDWNGTLLNDLEICIFSMNKLLKKRHYPLLTTERYKQIFTFPVKDYYIKAGVDFEKHDWVEIAMEFINNYRSNVVKSAIHPEAEKVLEYLAHKKYRQFVLSAMQHDFLLETINERLNIEIFEKIVGLNDHYAQTKVDNAKLLVDEIGLPKNEIVMIGDTIHDFEVAEATGISCVLFSEGHQSRGRLQDTGALVIDQLSELTELF